MGTVGSAFRHSPYDVCGAFFAETLRGHSSPKVIFFGVASVFCRCCELRSTCVGSFGYAPRTSGIHSSPSSAPPETTAWITSVRRRWALRRGAFASSVLQRDIVRILSGVAARFSCEEERVRKVLVCPVSLFNALQCQVGGELTASLLEYVCRLFVSAKLPRISAVC